MRELMISFRSRSAAICLRFCVACTLYTVHPRRQLVFGAELRRPWRQNVSGTDGCTVMEPAAFEFHHNFPY